MSRSPSPLTGVVVHWRNEELLAELAAAWPRDPRFELLVVDNGSTAAAAAAPAGVRVLAPGRNLGFAGGANAGIAAARGEIVLILNPDAVPEAGALDRLLEGFAAWPDAAGLAPRLVGPDGRVAVRLAAPRAAAALGLRAPRAARLPRLLRAAAPSRRPGRAVEQPAAAALAFRREALAAVGGFDAGFHPAWFEDVDLAQRLRRAGLRSPLLAGGPLPPPAGEHGAAARLRPLPLRSTTGISPAISPSTTARAGRWRRGRRWSSGSPSRLLALPLRAPPGGRASRREALAGLLGLLAGALSGWTPAGGGSRRRSLELRGAERRGRHLHRHPQLGGRPAGLPGGDRRAAPPAAGDRGGRLRERRRQPGGGAGARPGRASPSRRSGWRRTCGFAGRDERGLRPHPGPLGADPERRRPAGAGLS